MRFSNDKEKVYLTQKSVLPYETPKTFFITNLILALHAYFSTFASFKNNVKRNYYKQAY